MEEFRVLKTQQDGIHFLGQWLEENYQSQELSNGRLRTLFSEFIPSYPHVCDALTRGSGRPKKGSMTKAQAIDFFKELASYQRRETLSEEELILYAVLLRYDGVQKNNVNEYWYHKILDKFMKENPQFDSPSRASHALAKRLNGETKADPWRRIDLYRAYMRVTKKNKPQ